VTQVDVSPLLSVGASKQENIIQLAKEIAVVPPKYSNIA